MDSISWEDRAKAVLMPLRGGPKSTSAQKLVASLADTVAPNAALARPTLVERYRKATGALMADLLSVAARGRGGKRSMSANDFSHRENGFGYEVFRKVKDGFVALDLIQFKGGWKRVTTDAFDTPGFTIRSGGDYAYFRATPTLLKLAEEHGALPFEEHWRTGRLPKSSKAPMLELRAAKLDGQRRGALLPFKESEPFAAVYLRDLQETNAFLHATDIGGITSNGLKRVFNDGDLPGKRFRRGGRFYSRRGGDRYEMEGGEARRQLITINGEKVAEVDISACHLTIYYGLQRVPLDAASEDPYGSGDARLAVKLFAASAFGKGSTDGARWSSRNGIDYREERPGRTLGEDYPYAEIKRLVLNRHPIMRDLSATGLSALDFQFHESEIIRMAMGFLRHWGIASLPVHDSLIIPMSKASEAIVAIEKAFTYYFRQPSLKPRLKLKGLS